MSQLSPWVIPHLNVHRWHFDVLDEAGWRHILQPVLALPVDELLDYRKQQSAADCREPFLQVGTHKHLHQNRLYSHHALHIFERVWLLAHGDDGGVCAHAEADETNLIVPQGITFLYVIHSRYNILILFQANACIATVRAWVAFAMVTEVKRQNPIALPVQVLRHFEELDFFIEQFGEALELAGRIVLR